MGANINKVRRSGVERGSTVWKVNILTVTLPTPVSVYMYFLFPVSVKMHRYAHV